ncbi:phytanoyl-CoA dioxygenase family protein [Planctomyces sp. SH-PL14]|uniref:phytanoyl-CoA dioxygenase family protein n=1 Tax=Planctomyces sp. SH-PL14 TaxID=1632864 RepID=UPI00078E9F2C|nr:phytanoyl-CoA dioxygenase family protein [Planctomyces sp. SH-PL14]AMV16873.1 1-deoxypentalenic acid 11-beta-hydroxylase [Planctomyces sp. SH-PL14]
MPWFRPTDDDRAQFERDGFLIVRSLLSTEEVILLSQVARADKHLAETAYGRKDAAGAVVTLAVRNELTDDLYSAIARSARVVGAMQTFLGDEVYHYHHKLILKEPRVGGAWEWHQDYGYWYHNGCLTPDMGSCLIAIDRATQENGCLQVLAGTHKLGRIDHGKTGDQTGADMERVDVALKRHELVHVDLNPGDAVLFHANLLHRSDQNTSEDPRWALICCYNTRHNDPYKPGRHPGYSPIAVLEDEQVLAAGIAQKERIDRALAG